MRTYQWAGLLSREGMGAEGFAALAEEGAPRPGACASLGLGVGNAC